MCDICHKTHCDYRCPNAPDPATIYECAHCNEPIVAGDRYVYYDSNYYHEDCLPKAAPVLIADRDGLNKGVVTDNDSQMGTCPICNEPVLGYEERWVRGATMYHHECLEDHAKEMLNVCVLIADDEY